MRATTRKLNHDGTQTAPIAVAAMIDEFPTDPVGVEIADHRGRSGRARTMGVAIGDAPYTFEAFAIPQGGHQAPRGFLAFAAHDRRHMRFVGQNLSPVICGKDPAIDDVHAGHCRRDGPSDLRDDRMT
jgi:hypothetical protein